MTDRPIIFNADMIRALLDGRKTQDRRLLKHQPEAWCEAVEIGPYDDGSGPYGKPGHLIQRTLDNYRQWGLGGTVHAVGDRLWVRESWSDEHPLAVQEGRYSQEGRAGIPGPPRVRYRTIYKADGEPLQVWRNSGEYPYFTTAGPIDEIASKFPSVSSNFTNAMGDGISWTRSIHMPRWASRLTLIVKDVRVQRLQEISEADAVAEGVTPKPLTESGFAFGHRVAPREEPPRAAYRTLWNSIYGTDAWDDNPWVSATTFTVHRCNIDQMEAA